MLTLVGVESEIPVQIVRDGKTWPAVTSAELMVYAIRALGDSSVEAGETWCAEDLGCIQGAFLANGSRVYVDHELLEYSTPECCNTIDALAAVRAGDEIVRRAAAQLGQATGARVLAIRNNTDGHGNSYGAHINVRMTRQGFERLFGDPKVLNGFVIPLFVTLPLVCGSGSILHEGIQSKYIIWQRAPFLKTLVGWQTTMDRPIVSDRDEALAAHPERYARLHIIPFDANRMEVAEFLKLGVLRLACAAIDVGACDVDRELGDPISAVRQVTERPFEPLRLATGKTTTPLDIQRAYLQAFQRLHAAGTFGETVPDAGEILEQWQQVLDALGRDPLKLVGAVDWVTKLAWLEQVRSRRHLAWGDPRVRWLDIAYHTVAGPAAPDLPCKRLTTDARIKDLVTYAPQGSRASLRGTLIRRFGKELECTDWHRLALVADGRKFFLPDDPRPDAVDAMEKASDFSEAARGLGLERAADRMPGVLMAFAYAPDGCTLVSTLPSEAKNDRHKVKGGSDDTRNAGKR